MLWCVLTCTLPTNCLLNVKKYKVIAFETIITVLIPCSCSWTVGKDSGCVGERLFQEPVTGVPEDVRHQDDGSPQGKPGGDNGAGGGTARSDGHQNIQQDQGPATEGSHLQLEGTGISKKIIRTQSYITLSGKWKLYLIDYCLF